MHRGSVDPMIPSDISARTLPDDDLVELRIGFTRFQLTRDEACQTVVVLQELLPAPKIDLSAGTDHNPKSVFPEKYSRDGHGRVTVGDITKGMADLIDNDVPNKELSNYIDKEFLWGAWKHLVEKLGPEGNLFLKDIRGFIRAAYLEGRSRGDSEEPHWRPRG